MINNEIKLREILRNYNIVNITDLKAEQGALFFIHENIEDKYSIAFPNYILNFNRGLSIYPEIVQIDKSSLIKFAFLCENVIVNLITAMEDYLRSAFMIIAYISSLEELFFRYGKNGFNESGAVEIFNKCLNKLRVNIRLDYNNIDLLRNVKLLGLLPPITKLSFQQKDVVKYAFKMLNIELPDLFPDLWNRIFANNTDSYLKLRNKIIHSGAKDSLSGPKIDLSTVESCYIDIAKFIHCIDKKLIEDFPNQTILGV